MITLLLHLLRLFPFLFGGHRQLAVENLALRQQLAVYKRTTARPKLRTTDRLFWIWLARVWPGWRQPLAIVTPDTVLRLEKQRCAGRAPGDSSGSAGSDPKDESGELPLGSAQSPRRIAETRNQPFASNRCQVYGSSKETTLADLAGIPK